MLNRKVHGQPLIYFDNAATTQKPRTVIELVDRLHRETNSNVHRGVHYLSGEMTAIYESARRKIKDLLNARSEQEIIFTGGATAAINLAAFCFGESYLRPGSEVIVSAMEHHSNLVPWQIVCRRKGAKLRFIPFDDKGELRLEEYQKLLNERTRLVAVVHASNSLGTINPIEKIVEMAHRQNVPVLIDGAQAIAHRPVDVQRIGCDFYVFSGHKMYGPTGTGVLYGQERWLNDLPPYQSGGDMIEEVSLERSTYNQLPYKFEAGTPNFIGFAGLGAAVDYLTELGLDRIQAYEDGLRDYATGRLSAVAGLRIYGEAEEKVANLSFSLDGIPPYDVGLMLDKMGIAVRTGHHCTQPVWKQYGVEGSVRASLAFYNTPAEIDQLIEALERIQKIFR